MRRHLAALSLQNLQRPRGQSRQDLLQTAHKLESEARRARLPELIAEVLWKRADFLLGAMPDPQVPDSHQDEAIEVLTQALSELGDRRRHDLQVYIRVVLARAHAIRKDWSAVDRVCAEGIERVEQHRYGVSAPYLQSAYMRDRADLYTLGARAAYELGEGSRALHRAELCKARTLLRQCARGPEREAPPETLRTLVAELRDVSRQLGAATGGQREELLHKRRELWDRIFIRRAQGGAALPEFSIEKVQRVLSTDEAVLYYFWLDKHALLITALDREVVVSTLCRFEAEERKAVVAFAESILALEHESTELERYLERFSALLLPPELAEIFAGKERLIISPHRVLHALPMHALFWQGGFLIESLAVTYVPNLSSLLLPCPPRRERRVLALGIKRFTMSGSDRPLVELHGAEEEIDALEEVYQEASPPVPFVSVKGDEATRAGFLKLEPILRTSSIVHLATHGQNVDGDTPMESRLALQDEYLDGLDLALLLLDAELVVLSACSSGQRSIAGRGLDELPGDDWFGLPASFFIAGARRILCALWPADDDITSQKLMVPFHRELAAGLPPELAWQQSVIQFLRDKQNMFNEVFYWAPFFLTAMGRPQR